MQTENHLFHEVFLKYGGIEDFSTHKNVPSIFSENLEVIKYTAREVHTHYPKVPILHTGFVANFGINASATLYANKGFIGIFLGTMLCAVDMFYKIFASKNILQDIGDPSLESDEKHVLSLEQNKNLFVVIERFGEGFPKDPVRQMHGGYYAGLLMQFVVYHEFCHILRGHAGYANSLNKNGGWVEKKQVDNIVLLGQDFCWTCEMDADCFAVNRILNRARIPLNQPEQLVDPTFQIFYTDWAKIIFDLIFVIYSYFRLMDLSFVEGEKNAHPPPLVRVNYICHCIRAKFQGNFINELKEEDLDRVMATAIGSAEKSFTQITHCEINYTGLLNFDSKENSILMDKILYNWNNVRPKIEPFSFAELPPLKSA